MQHVFKTISSLLNSPILKWGAKLQQVTPKSCASFWASRRLMWSSQSLRSPWVQPVTKTWEQGEKLQATMLASLAVAHLWEKIIRAVCLKDKEGLLWKCLTLYNSVEMRGLIRETGLNKSSDKKEAFIFLENKYTLSAFKLTWNEYVFLY